MSADGAASFLGATIARGLGRESEIKWPLGKSADLFELKYGKALVESDRRQGKIPVYGTNGQTGTHDTALFHGPGVVVGRKGVGHLGVEWVDSDYWVIDTAYSLMPSDSIDLKFAYYLVFYVGLDHLKHGTSNPSLTRDAFGTQLFPVPPLSAQRGIATTLGALDDKIESNQRAVELTSSLLDALAADSALDLPRVRLGDFVEKTKDTSDPVKLGTQLVDHYSLPAFDQNERPERVPAADIMSNKLAVPGRSILVSRLNPRINRIWWVTPSDGFPALASTEFLCLRAQNDANLAAAWLAVRTEEFRTELPQRVTGTSGSHQRVRPEDVLDIQVPDMSRTPIETKWAALALLENRERLSAESSGLAELRDALLPELLSGRLRAPEVEEAVAEVIA